MLSFFFFFLILKKYTLFLIHFYNNRESSDNVNQLSLSSIQVDNTEDMMDDDELIWD